MNLNFLVVFCLVVFFTGWEGGGVLPFLLSFIVVLFSI